MSELKFLVWNMEWLNDLFVSDSQSPAFRADTVTDLPHSSGVTVATRRSHLAGVINELAPDIVVLCEGPSRAAELQLLFDHDDFQGTWQTRLQPSRYQDPETGHTITSQQNIGIAVRTDQDKFEDVPVEMFDTSDTAKFPYFSYFLVDVDEDGIKEQYRFERRPLYVEVRPKVGARFRILGLHLKSKGVFGAYEWSKWWQLAEANRRKLLAQTSQIRLRFLDPYLSDPGALPLIVCGDINDGPGLDESEKRLFGSGVERLMGTVWKPELCLRNALFDSLNAREKAELDFEKVVTARFQDPIFNSTTHAVWIDHILYSSNLQWVSNGTWEHKIRQGSQERNLLSVFRHASDHNPVTATLTV